MSEILPLTVQTNKPTFEESYEEVKKIVNRRRGSWTYLSIIEWQEVESLLIIRVWEKWHLYDPEKAPKLEHWINTLVTNAIKNLKRDQVLRTSRPCIGGGASNGVPCVFNMGGDSCRYTKSRTQCAECPTYARWQKEKEAQHNLRSKVALENHAQEVSNIQSDFTDINAIKEQIDELMLKELNRWEKKVYKLLFIKNMTPAEVSEKLIEGSKTRKRPLGPTEQTSYQHVLILQREFKEMMKSILVREGHL